jgi:hypothetical protein
MRAGWVMVASGVLLISAAAAHAKAMTCAQAMTLVHNQPNIETSAIMSLLTNQWQQMDRATVSTGHAPIAAKLAASQAAFNLVSAQCNVTPGMPLNRAAAQAYLRARATLDGY